MGGPCPAPPPGHLSQVNAALETFPYSLRGLSRDRFLCFVKTQVASGQYSSASEVTREALRGHMRSIRQREFEQRLELSRKAWSAGDVTEADENLL